MDSETLKLNIENKENLCFWILATDFTQSSFIGDLHIKKCNFFKGKNISEFNFQNIEKKYSFYDRSGMIIYFYFINNDKLFIQTIHMISEHPTSGVYEYEYNYNCKKLFEFKQLN